MSQTMREVFMDRMKERNEEIEFLRKEVIKLREENTQLKIKIAGLRRTGIAYDREPATAE